MKIMISGHRKEKLKSYRESFIRSEIDNILCNSVSQGLTLIGLCGMADGVDLWFCESCDVLNIPVRPFIPFEFQDEYMSEYDKILRKNIINKAKIKYHCRNSYMVTECDSAIVVWDGNKGGTHNVLQQLIENKKPFYWINPVSEHTVFMD